MIQGRKRPSAVGDSPLWKILLVSFFAPGVLATIFAFLPTYSPVALAVGVGVTLGGATALAWSNRTNNWWTRVVGMNSLLLLLMGIALRAWASVIPQVWIWLTFPVAAYVLAWMLPAINPKLSAQLLNEQMAPETRWGRGCLSVALVIGPAAGTLGASVGMYGSRFGQGPLVLIATGALLSMTTVAFAQAASQQLWPDRPWARNAEVTSTDIRS